MKISQRLLAIVRRTGRFLAVAAWWALGIWAMLAIFFTAPGSAWLGWPLAFAVIWPFWKARRERKKSKDSPEAASRSKRYSLVALAAAAIVGVYYFGFVTPDPNQNWVAEQSRMPIVDVEGDKVYVKDIRNFTWRTATDFDAKFYDRVYDVSKINSMYYIVAPMPVWDGVAHVFVSFGFTDGQHCTVSVEGRRVVGKPYRLIPSLFRQYQLIYVVGDERDVLGLRGAIWKKQVFFYPAKTTKERMQRIFVDMMQRAHDLEEHPEFYNLVTNNCMNNITDHLRLLGGRTVPHDIRLLLTGLSDRLAHRYGFIDTDLPFEAARRAFRVDQWMQTTPLDEGFSDRLREQLAKQVAEEQKKAGEAK
ncbi:lipoprotein N-acyltransferase Lnb domain-containing protein [Aeoliella sp. SH292]|uniref:lipoprotein N-acyltransferase Lnb domain-containing protein n=1 Tax=Aeoliella sp. SH292 TaxID=3454464 RepID=UPI003F9B05D9